VLVGSERELSPWNRLGRGYSRLVSDLRADAKPDLFSGGQSQRMMIARALMHQPQVLFGEPSTGVPNRINIVFPLVFTPLLFTGCSQYPWPSLSRLEWFQVVTAAKPDDLCERGDARRARALGTPHRTVGVRRRARGVARGVDRGRSPGVLPPCDRLTAEARPART
jgi:hypothetical protein